MPTRCATPRSGATSIPHLTITDRPFRWRRSRRASNRCTSTRRWSARVAQQIVDEGYFHAPPVVPPARLAALRLGAERIVAAGFPSGFTCLYDEFYQAFEGLDALFAPILGERYLMVLQGLWTYVVPAGDPAYRQWTTVAPHRDTLGPDPRVLARDVPSIINVWIPADRRQPRSTRASTSCRRRAIRITIQPIAASIRSASGCRTCARCRRPPAPCSAGRRTWCTGAAAAASSRPDRAVSITVYFQRRDVAPMHPARSSSARRFPSMSRLSWIGGSLGIADLWERRRACPSDARTAARHARQPARAVAGQHRRRAHRRRGGPPCRIVVIKTSGDRLQDAPLSEIGGKRLFVKEIEDALLRGEIDLAVHSSKDMPAVLPEGLAIGGVLPRENPLDAVVLPGRNHRRRTRRPPARHRRGHRARRRRSARAACAASRSSCGFSRRALRADPRQPRHAASQTRRRRVRCARAGGGRPDGSGFASRISVELPATACVPAPGQGIVAIEIREGDEAMRQTVSRITDSAAGAALDAERAVVVALGGGCQTPIGALASAGGSPAER